MKLIFPCTTCYSQGQKNIESAVDITDDGVYEVTCQNGHQSVEFIKNDKYEILFDLGMLSIYNGFSREAVSSLAASLERFHEYTIRVILLDNKINEIDFEDTWKLVSNQSERQLGAFYFLYLTTFGEAPDQFSQKQTHFRNKVIHKGYIPTEEEVFKYAIEVFNYIVKITIKIKEKLSESMERYFKEQLTKVKQSFNCKVSTPIYGTILDKSRTIHILSEINLENEYKYVKAEYLMYSK